MKPPSYYHGQMESQVMQQQTSWIKTREQLPAVDRKDSQNSDIPSEGIEINIPDSEMR